MLSTVIFLTQLVGKFFFSRICYGIAFQMLGFFFVLGLLPVFGDVEIVYIKNNGPPACIWINGAFQGTARGGTCYTVREGFVTADSGWQSDGRLVMKYAGAGWDASGTIEFLAVAQSLDETRSWRQTFANSGKELRIWIGGAPAIQPLEIEFADKIQLSGDCNSLFGAISTDPGEKADDSGGDGGESTSGTTISMLTSGRPIKITSPTSGFSTEQRVVSVSGTVKNSSVKSIVLNVNGRSVTCPVNNGSFSGVVTLTVGQNTIKAISSDGRASSKAVVVNCTDEPSQLWVELAWNGSGDVDLHVRQPNGVTVGYDNKSPAGGGQLDVDNTKGYGPEHYFISAAKGDTVYRGTYSIYLVHYRSDGPVTCRVTVFKNEKFYGNYSGALNGTGSRLNITDVALP